jgi:O-antigen/teichoic acid export membrane protein
MLGGKGISALLSLIYLAIVTRSLGLDGFGQFALALSAGQAIELLVTFQSWQIVVRYGMPHFHAGRVGELARLLRFTIWLDIAGALVSATFVIIVMQLLSKPFAWSADFTMRATGCCVLLVLSTHWTPIGVLRMHDRFATAALADAMTPITRCVGAVLIWLIGPSVIGFLAVWALAEFVTAIAYWVSAFRLGGLSWRVERPVRWREFMDANPGIGTYALTTNLNSSLDVGGKQIAVMLVGLLLTPAAVGGFRLAQQLAQSLAKFSQTVARALFPELMRSRAIGTGTTSFETVLAGAFRLAGLGAILVFLVLLLFGRPGLQLIAGAEFAWAYPILLLLGTSAAVEFAAVGFEPALVAIGRPALVLKIRCISSAILLIVIAALTPHFGTSGAGIAALASSILSMTLLSWALRSALRNQRSSQSPSEPVITVLPASRVRAPYRRDRAAGAVPPGP